MKSIRASATGFESMSAENVCQRDWHGRPQLAFLGDVRIDVANRARRPHIPAPSGAGTRVLELRTAWLSPPSSCYFWRKQGTVPQSACVELGAVQSPFSQSFPNTCGWRTAVGPPAAPPPRYGAIGAATLKTSVRTACSTGCCRPRATHFAIRVAVSSASDSPDTSLRVSAQISRPKLR